MPYEEYFNDASEGLIIVDRSGHILETNPSADQLFGYSEAELVGQPIEFLMPARIHELHRKHMQDFFALPRTRAMGNGLNLAARRKDGSEFPVEISLNYARDTPRGNLVVAAVVDISGRLALEIAARRAETVHSIGTMAAGIAHDLGTPLQVIRARAELLMEATRTATDSEKSDDAAAIYRQAQRAGHIVEGFLELSGQREKTITNVDLQQVIDHVLLLIGDQIRKVEIEVRTNMQPNLPTIMGDGVALERVLINLIENARDAMPEGGSIVITSGLISERPGWLHLSIADTGSGIPADALGKVFSMLYTTKPRGGGLGLWLSQRIVQEHNGRIEVQSEPGKGATFTITLPTMDSSRAFECHV